MSFYIQQKLPEMTTVFGKTMDDFVIESFDEFPSSNECLFSSLGMKTISELLNSSIKTIDKDELRGVKTYTGSAYKNINNYLRGLGKNVGVYEKEQIKFCESALKKASLPEETIVRRGASYNMLEELGIDYSKENKYKFIGGIVQDKGFFSTIFQNLYTI